MLTKRNVIPGSSWIFQGDDKGCPYTILLGFKQHLLDDVAIYKTRNVLFSLKVYATPTNKTVVPQPTSTSSRLYHQPKPPTETTKRPRNREWHPASTTHAMGLASFTLMTLDLAASYGVKQSDLVRWESWSTTYLRMKGFFGGIFRKIVMDVFFGGLVEVWKTLKFLNWRIELDGDFELWRKQTLE